MRTESAIHRLDLRVFALVGVALLVLESVDFPIARAQTPPTARVQTPPAARPPAVPGATTVRILMPRNVENVALRPVAFRANEWIVALETQRPVRETHDHSLHAVHRGSLGPAMQRMSVDAFGELVPWPGSPALAYLSVANDDDASQHLVRPFGAAIASVGFHDVPAWTNNVGRLHIAWSNPTRPTGLAVRVGQDFGPCPPRPPRAPSPLDRFREVATTSGAEHCPRAWRASAVWFDGTAATERPLASETQPMQHTVSAVRAIVTPQGFVGTYIVTPSPPGTAPTGPRFELRGQAFDARGRPTWNATLAPPDTSSQVHSAVDGAGNIVFATQGSDAGRASLVLFGWTPTGTPLPVRRVPHLEPMSVTDIAVAACASSVWVVSYELDLPRHEYTLRATRWDTAAGTVAPMQEIHRYAVPASHRVSASSRISQAVSLRCDAGYVALAFDVLQGNESNGARSQMGFATWPDR